MDKLPISRLVRRRWLHERAAEIMLAVAAMESGDGMIHIPLEGGGSVDLPAAEYLKRVAAELESASKERL